MKLLLTSSGLSNAAILLALRDLLGKPVEDSTALVIPTAVLPFDVGTDLAARLVRGETRTPLTNVGWRSCGLLELSVLPSIGASSWVPAVESADALLFWGGDPVFLSHWIEKSGLGAILPSYRGVYVGVSAGSMAACTTFGETYTEPRTCAGDPISSEEVAFEAGTRSLLLARGAALVDFAVIPHFEHPDHPDACGRDAELWASRIPVPTYAIGDETALAVRDGSVDVVTEGRWRLFAD